MLHCKMKNITYFQKSMYRRSLLQHPKSKSVSNWTYKLTNHTPHSPRSNWTRNMWRSCHGPPWSPRSSQHPQPTRGPRWSFLITPNCPRWDWTYHVCTALTLSRTVPMPPRRERDLRMFQGQVGTREWPESNAQDENVKAEQTVSVRQVHCFLETPHLVPDTNLVVLSLADVHSEIMWKLLSTSRRFGIHSGQGSLSFHWCWTLSGLRIGASEAL